MTKEDLDKTFPDNFELFLLLNAEDINGKKYIPVEKIRKWLKKKIESIELEALYQKHSKQLGYMSALEIIKEGVK